MNDDSRIVCHTPTPGKKPTRIHKWKYDMLRGIILDILDGSADGVEFRSLSGLIEARLSAEQRANLGSVGWYTTTVKLDMEVQGDIVRIPNTSPQRLRLVDRSHQPGANAESRSP